MKANQIAVLILSTQADEYIQFIQAISKTWRTELNNAGVVSYFYSGGHLQDEIIRDNIHLTTSDNLLNTAKKLKDALKLLLSAHPNIKLIYRTNLSSYIHVDTFLKFIETNELSESTYAGFIGTTSIILEYFRRDKKDHTHLLAPFKHFLPKISFASGSGFFLGTELAKTFSESEFANNLIDDVMVAKVLNIQPSRNKAPLRFDILENDEHKIPLEEYQTLVNEKLLFHYRFKTSNRIKDANMLESFNDPINRLKACTIKTN